MKKYILLLLISSFAIAQTVPPDASSFENLQITNNSLDTIANKVSVQNSSGVQNYINKTDLIDNVFVATVGDLPTTGVDGKIYVVKNVNKSYRWNGTFYQELSVTDISGKEDTSNKQNSLATDGTGTKIPTVDAVNGIDLQKVIDNGNSVNSDSNVYYNSVSDGGRFSFTLGSSIFNFYDHVNNYFTSFGAGAFSFNNTALSNGIDFIFDRASSGYFNLRFPDKPTGDYTLATTNDAIPPNAAITPNVKTKITYDANGLVTAGANLIASDIPNIAESQVTNLTTDLAGKQASLGFTPENSANKNASSGYVGLSGFNPIFRNITNTFSSFFTNSNTAARTYTFQDRNGTIADNTDLALKANLVTPTFTGGYIAVGGLTTGIQLNSFTNSIIIGNVNAIQKSGAYLIYGASSITEHIFQSNNDEAMRTSSLNNLLIGSSTDYRAKLQVSGDSLQMGNLFFAQPTPTALTATGTLTIAQMLTSLITVTSGVAVLLTLPTGTLTDAGILAGSMPINNAFEWTIINVGSSSGVVVIQAGVNHTFVGSANVIVNGQATFRTVKTATNTFITYRVY